MLLIDSNVWLALAIEKHQFHRTARQWLRQRGRREALFCRATHQSLLRLLTTRAVMAQYESPPLKNKQAWSIYESLRADSRVGWAEEPRDLESGWKSLAGTTQASPKLWMDAYLAAFAIECGFQFVTTDKAFRQFKKLDLVLLST
jgi:uncharacterized protein